MWKLYSQHLGAFAVLFIVQNIMSFLVTGDQATAGEVLTIFLFYLVFNMARIEKRLDIMQEINELEDEIKKRKKEGRWDES